MPLIKFISSQHDLVKEVVKGGKPFEILNHSTGKNEWYLRRALGQNRRQQQYVEGSLLRILASVARAAVRNGLIEQKPGSSYWRLTDKGRAFHTHSPRERKRS